MSIREPLDRLGEKKVPSMPEFMLLVVANEFLEDRLTPAETSGLIEGQAAYERSLREASALVDCEHLRPSREGVRMGHGRAEAQSGPFADEALSAYYIVQAESLEAAVALARRCPSAPGGSLEVRPLMKRHTYPEKSSHPGRIFAFGVLGSASSEAGWVEVMDRIDARTRGGFPGERWLGGVRLEAPGRGGRLGAGGSSRAVFDEPFLESKEVIGGLFFLRLASLEEAIQWARETPFVQEGALEIRELWRC